MWKFDEMLLFRCDARGGISRGALFFLTYATCTSASFFKIIT